MSDLRERLDECLVSMAARGRCHNSESLHPRLWERLRQRLQNIYRVATGESMAVLSVDNAEINRITRELSEARAAIAVVTDWRQAGLLLLPELRSGSEPAMKRVTRGTAKLLKALERVAGIEPAYSAWKAVRMENKINAELHF